MSYEKMISRTEPGLIVLLLDDSASMADHLPGTNDPKYAWNERYFGLIVKELLGRCTEVKGTDIVIRPRYYFHVASYGSNLQVWGDEVMDLQAVVEKYTKANNSLGLGGRLSGTDTARAFEHVRNVLSRTLQQGQFRNSFPAMVLHLTDGESQSDASVVAEQIKQLATADGNVLLVNAYIGTQTSLSYQGPEDFPGYIDIAEAGPRDDNTRMFAMSSVLPESIRANLAVDAVFPRMRAGSRLFFDVRTKEMLMHVIQVVGSLGSRAVR